MYVIACPYRSAVGPSIPIILVPRPSPYSYSFIFSIVLRRRALLASGIRRCSSFRRRGAC